MPKNFSEILKEETDRIERLVKFATGTGHPILYMCLLQSLNAMRYAASSAKRSEEGSGEVPTGFDIPAAIEQFKDFLRTLPNQKAGTAEKGKA